MSCGCACLWLIANGLAVAGNKEKSDSSTTHAAVGDGTIIINDTAKQQQNVDDLSRDVAHANQTLSPIFDKEKEQQRMQTLQLIGEIGNQAADIARTQGEIAGLKAQSDPAALEAARAELMVHGNSHPTSEQVAKQAYQNAKATFGTGGDIQQAITASTAAIQGLAGGDIAKALAGASAPYLAEVIHRQTSTADGEVNKTANLMAHAVVNAALSLAKGENALAGASSAVTAEAVGMISKAYYDKKPSELDESQKQTISALASLAAGLAGGLVGGDTASAVSGMQTGKVTVENNWLHEDESRQLDKEMQDCKKSGGDCQKIIKKYIDISNKNSKELKDACTGGGATCVTWEELIQADTNVALDADRYQVRLSEKLEDPDAAAIVKYLNGSDLKFLKDNITTGDRVMDVVLTPTSWPVAIMGGKAIITNAVNNTKEQLIAVGVGTAAGAGIQYGTTGEVKLSDVIGSGVIGAITTGKGYNPTMAWNAAGGYYQAEISGDDPFLAALMSKAGASAGYATGNIIKVPMDKILNPVSKQYEWVPTGVWTITKPASQHPLPSIVGNMGDSVASGLVPEYLEKKPDSKK
ncbi:VENN motif pre-toxin domain-containing protein [Rosenbergiella epipactidis]|uniref:VENN motif pre-toxin domain-containing protein n=1 Tax=Rosenbergiella epipactidis TaxID=1544694 RepID=UPI001F4DE8B4|nr:VENN motif pre-toxin domain-containing protein [Rosenbergiella epipactidis]